MTSIEQITDPALAALGDQAPVDRAVPVLFHDFEFGDGTVSRIAIARHRADSGVSVVVSLGGISRHAFVCVVDGLEREFAEVLAKLEHIDTPLSRLRAGDFVELLVPVSSSWVGVQLLDVVASGATSGFPTHLQTVRGQMHCLWVVPLNVVDLKIRKDGLELLLDHLESTGRNPINVRVAV